MNYTLLLLLFFIGSPFLNGQNFSIKHQTDNGITLLGLKTIGEVTVLDGIVNAPQFRFDNQTIPVQQCLRETDDRRIHVILNDQEAHVVRGLDHSDFNGELLVAARLLVRDSIVYCNESFSRIGNQGGNEILLLGYDNQGNLIQDRVFENENASAYSLRDVKVTDDKILLSGAYYYDDFVIDGLVFEAFSRGQGEGFYVEVSADNFTAISGGRLNGLHDDRVVNVVQHSEGDHILVETSSPEACFRNVCASSGLQTSFRTRANGIILRNQQGEVQSFDFVKHASGTSTLALESNDNQLFAFGTFNWDTVDVFGTKLFRSSIDAGFITSLNSELQSIEAKKIEATDQLFIVDAKIVRNKLMLVGLYEDKLYYDDTLVKNSQDENVNSFLMILDAKTLNLDSCFSIYGDGGIVYGIEFISNESRNLLHLNLRNSNAVYIDQEKHEVHQGYENGAVILDISNDVLLHNQNQSHDSNLRIIPNPTDGMLFVKSDKSFDIINIRSLSGNVIRSYKKEDNFDGRIDISSLPNGLYNIQVGGGEGSFVQQLIVKM